MTALSGTSIFGFQSFFTDSVSQPSYAIFFTGTNKPAEGEYVGWLNLHSYNGVSWLEVASKPIYGQGLWLFAPTSGSNRRLSAIWRRAGLSWTAYSGTFP